MRINRILVMGLTLCMVFMANAQTEEGNVLLGGGAKFTSQNSTWETDHGRGDDVLLNSFEFSPQISVFVHDGLALGVEMPINHFSRKYDDRTNSATIISVAPFMRHYFDLDNMKRQLYLHVGVGFGNVNEKSRRIIGSSDFEVSDLFLYDLGGGLAIFFNEKVSLDIGLRYSSRSIKSKEDNDLNRRDILSGLASSIGFVFVL